MDIENYSLLIVSPFIIQALAITIDEFYFHHQRGLGLWERIGHPMDTITVLISYTFCLSYSYSPSNLLVFIGLSTFSCLFVTKDEFVHNDLCSGPEQWLHSILFLVHSLCFFTLGILWSLPKSTTLLSISSFINLTIFDFIIGQIFILCVFTIYQILFWNFKPIQRLIWTK